jgi:hypothetical protein
VFTGRKRGRRTRNRGAIAHGKTTPGKTGCEKHPIFPQAVQPCRQDPPKMRALAPEGRLSRPSKAFLKPVLFTVISKSSCPPDRSGGTPNRLRKNLILGLILGGAAVYRCDNPRFFISGFSRCGQTVTQKTLFPQVVQRCDNGFVFIGGFSRGGHRFNFLAQPAKFCRPIPPRSRPPANHLCHSERTEVPGNALLSSVLVWVSEGPAFCPRHRG